MASSDDDNGAIPILSVLGSLQTLLLNTPDVEDFLHKVSQLACAVVEPPASCGITTRYDDHPITIASSDQRANLMDQQQYDSGEGPCLHALHTGTPVEIIDQSTDERWSGHHKLAVEQGVRWVLSLPLTVGENTLGAMNVYGFAGPSALAGEQRHNIEIFAARAATALALALQRTEQQELAVQLEQALASRSVIDQAIGVLMAQQRCSADNAFDLLRRHSQNSRRKLRDVATEVITRYTGQQPSGPAPFQHNTNPPEAG